MSGLSVSSSSPDSHQNKNRKIIIGTRQSKLALAQAQQIKELILVHYPSYRSNPQLIEIKNFTTTGDRFLDRNLSDIGGKGLFTKEIEEALLSKEIDIAVHSLKDMPAESPAGLVLCAFPEREDPRDAFISIKYKSLIDLPENAIVGSSSTRRKALLLNARPDLQVVNFRGNVTSRISKIEAGQVDATILAVAGLRRINMQNYINQIIDPQLMLPAVAQGALAVQSRAGDEFIRDLVRPLNHVETEICVRAERAFLQVIDGSCKTPIAANAYIENDSLRLNALVASLNGKEIYKAQRVGKLLDTEKLGHDIGLEIKERAGHIINSFKR